MTINDVYEAINKLDCNKSCGADDIYAEHLKKSYIRLRFLGGPVENVRERTIISRSPVQFAGPISKK